nr:exonuclease SbcCD subunit D [Lachnospiraceae bacterium]
LKEIVKEAEKRKPDAVVIAGDIYDKAIPSAEAVQMFDGFLKDITEALPEAEIMMISGNHDSAARLNIYRSLLAREKIHMIGLPPEAPEDHIEKLVLEDEYGPVNFWLLPFVKPSMVRLITRQDENDRAYSYDEVIHILLEREKIDPAERNVFVSHQFYLPKGKDASEIERMDSEIVTVGNIDAVSSDVLEKFDYAALGHVHKPMKVGNEYYRYSGTPMASSFSEAGQEKGIIEVELKAKGEIDTTVIPLKPLHEVKTIKGELEEILQMGSDDYVSVMLTDVEGSIEPSEANDRIKAAFPNVLEIRRQNIRRADYSGRVNVKKELDPFELCCSFLAEPDEEQKELLKDVINSVLEADR